MVAAPTLMVSTFPKKRMWVLDGKRLHRTSHPFGHFYRPGVVGPR